MQLFILFSMPLYLGQLIHWHRDDIQDLSQIRSSAIRGVVYGALSAAVFFTLYMLVTLSIRPLPLYVYNSTLYFLVPVLFLIIMGRGQLKKNGVDGNAASLLIRVQFTGFFLFFNAGLYFIHSGNYGQFVILVLPLLYLFLIPVLARIMIRSRRFEKHWNFIMYVSFFLILIAAPITAVLFSFLMYFWGWTALLIILFFLILSDRFFSRLEHDIQYRLELEGKMKPLVRLFSGR
ncbi:hypothetical protein [Salinispira pacifica]|uniref:Uncharacterized protein n=1 Tax=Salinispira pacifica TaxID=1307761 RepID=V5WGH8_9SPIO|nr:hypothetical protein [Salinispira pacifica]AHC14654.1 hypothetical protein L21SP2_1253 [Salinispira pacifica]